MKKEKGNYIDKTAVPGAIPAVYPSYLKNKNSCNNLKA